MSELILLGIWNYTLYVWTYTLYVWTCQWSHPFLNLGRSDGFLNGRPLPCSRWVRLACHFDLFLVRISRSGGIPHFDLFLVRDGLGFWPDGRGVGASTSSASPGSSDRHSGHGSQSGVFQNYGFGLQLEDIWTLRPGFYSEVRYTSPWHSGLALGVILEKYTTYKEQLHVSIMSMCQTSRHVCLNRQESLLGTP